MKFNRNKEPFAGITDPRSAGNGALMRLASIPMFYYPDKAKVNHYAVESSKTTHGANECLWVNQIFASMIIKAFDGKDKE